MSIVDIVKQAAEQQIAITLWYKNENRLVSPTQIKYIPSTGNTVLIGLEPEKGWRSYLFERLTNVKLTRIPHENVAEINLESFNGKLSDE